MFTGIIEEVSPIVSNKNFGKGRAFQVQGSIALKDIATGDSIAINGVCLTVVDFNDSTFSVEAVEETIKKSTLGDLNAGNEVNVERALRAGGKLGGHYVQGHVDCTATLQSIEKRQESWLFWFSYPDEYRANIIPVGSIAIDGVSLTVAEMKEGLFAVSVIPHTYEHTLFRTYSSGTVVNIEFDMIGKYVLNFLRSQGNAGVDMNLLRELGY